MAHRLNEDRRDSQWPRLAEWEKTLETNPEARLERAPPRAPCGVATATQGLTGIILAGGEGKRMGLPKAFLTIRDKPMIHWIMDRLRPLCDEFIVVIEPEVVNGGAWNQIKKRTASAPDLILRATSFEWPSDAKIVHDYVRGKGPLCGILSGLAVALNEWSFVVSCDAPFVSPQLARTLLNYAGQSDVVVAEQGGKLQPLQGLYRQDAGPAALRRLQSNRLKMMEFLKDPSLRVHTVREAEWSARGVSPLTFTNVNTPDDLTSVSRLLDDPEYADLLADQP
jgi:molybdopterin-guanine dinucleotide biosynthesis protein A